MDVARVALTAAMLVWWALCVYWAALSCAKSYPTIYAAKGIEGEDWFLGLILGSFIAAGVPFGVYGLWRLAGVLLGGSP